MPLLRGTPTQRGLRREDDRQHPPIRVNVVCPGIVAGTPMRKAVERQGQAFGLPPSAERAKTIPLGRLATAEDIASVVAFLACDEAGNVTGGLWLH